MTFLPIVERELRVASRRRLTYWGRFSAAAFALIIFGGLQTIFSVSRGVPFSVGWYEFQVMKWLCFFIAASAGLFLTADTVSEEKREGTLGLLFLTDLRGHDVIFGKLISHSTQAFYGLLAAFPILGLTLLIGGVSGAEFGRTTLVICNTVFLSLSLGLLISSLSRDGMKALNGTLLLLLLLLGGAFIADMGLAGWNESKFIPPVCRASPAYLLSKAHLRATNDWWFNLGLQHFLGWLALIVSSVCVPWAWQDKGSRTNTSSQTVGQRWRFGGPGARLRLRRKFLSLNPLLWLAARDRWMPRLVWAAPALSLAIFLCHEIAGINQPFWLRQLEGIVQFVIYCVFFLWLASQASRFFVEAMRNGALELILVTPATPAQIVKGQWRALCRTFLLPALLLLLIMVAAHVLQIREYLSQIPGRTRMTSINGFSPVSYELVGTVTGVVWFGSGLLTVAWYGMWMGMTTRKSSIAVLKTLAFAIVLPALALLFVQGMTMAFLMYPGWRNVFPFWMAGIFVSVLNLIKNLFFIFWSRQRLATRFCHQAANDHRLPRLAVTPGFPVAPPIATPPPPVPPPTPPPISVGMK
jgi:ABC-type transport system involved in cytochrome c biogenesis permease component